MAPEMHRRFQQETVNLQVTTAKAYLELLQRGEIAGASVPPKRRRIPRRRRTRCWSI